MSKHERILKLMNEVTEDLERTAISMEALSAAMPAGSPHFSIMEVIGIMQQIPRLEASLARLGAARAILNARTGGVS